jgi:hypothetical protein
MPLGEPPPDVNADEGLSDVDRKGLEDWAAHQANGTVVHVPINSTRPHTLAFALNDSPAGLAAWLVDKQRLRWRRRDELHQGRIARQCDHLLGDGHDRIGVADVLRTGARSFAEP